MSEFIIVFREVLEASLVVGIVYLLLEKSNLKSHFTKLWLGVGAAVAASIMVGYFVILAKNSLGNDSTKALFEGIFLYITAILIWYVIFWLSKNVSNKNELETNTLEAIKLSSWGVFFVVFFAILREGFETAVFLISSLSITGSFSYLGFFMGAFLAILIGYLIVRQGRKIDIRSIFKYSTLLLVFLASGMVAYGTHEVEEYIVKSEIIEDFDSKEIFRPWNILEPKENLSDKDLSFMYTYDENKNRYTHLLHDKGGIGVFLKGFFGYNSNPNLPEVLLWMLSLFLGIRMWRGFYY
ncbi:MAG: FTR1 family protein [SAR86 cluster bacterium]|nr:FTR1 family protein [SAR86 cluster bacterium]MDG1948868.1 FTR1 family protein [SAR86 cluster bacterium]MDG2091676.1 FTR1 family protein [SAR86 cluster bacterium]|tara:strand:+ start:1724 stop:2611 length:888 start_codon:yes stop_codon:yes gene_type:complete